MAIINRNPVIRVDDDSIIDSTWIRIIGYNGEDRSKAPSNTTIQFAFYASEDKWDADCIKNIIRVVGIGDNDRLTLPYSRVENGIDIPTYWYTKLIEHLLTVFPDWSMDNITVKLD